MATVESYLDRYLDPLTEALTPEVARSILSLHPDPEVVARVEQLGEKSNAGTLTDAERNDF